MQKNKLAYLELPASDVACLKEFYGSLFGWTFQDFGGEYAAFGNSGLDGGFNGVSKDRTKAPLAIIETDDLEATQEQVRSAGGVITMPIFPSPAGDASTSWTQAAMSSQSCR